MYCVIVRIDGNPGTIHFRNVRADCLAGVIEAARDMRGVLSIETQPEPYDG